MNSNSQQRPRRRNARRNRGRKSGGTVEAYHYAKPILRNIVRPNLDITVHSSGLLTAGVIGTDGYISTIAWNSFSELANLVELYQYFEITGYKLDVSLSPSVATFYQGAAAYRPINYLAGEVGSSAAPTNAYPIMELPGAVWLQAGTQNKGKWCPSTCKQVYSTRAAISGANSAGNLIFYVNNVGVIESVGGYDLKLNLKFYSKQYSSTV